MKKYLFIFLCLILLVGCSSENENTEEDYKTLMKDNDYIIVDVRTKEEYDESHIKDSINIPYDVIDNNSNLDKNKYIFVYCKSGVRSEKAYNTLKSLGYKVYNLGAFDSIDLPKE